MHSVTLVARGWALGVFAWVKSSALVAEFSLACFACHVITHFNLLNELNGAIRVRTPLPFTFLNEFVKLTLYDIIANVSESFFV